MNLKLLSPLVFLTLPVSCTGTQQRYRYVDYGAMSDHQRGEMLIERVKVKNLKAFILDDSAYENKDICEWVGIACNSAGSVTDVAWDFYSLSGFMDLSWIPPKTANFQLQGNSISGTIEAIKLPRTLQKINIDGCAFQGELRFLDLPANLKHLLIPGNNITGMIWITHAQESLQNADFRENYFESVISSGDESGACIRGLTSVTELRENQQMHDACSSLQNRELLVHREHDGKVWLKSVFADSEGHIQNVFWPKMSLEGEVPCRQLPQFMLSMHMNDNNLRGTVDLCALPRSLRVLDLHNNSIQQDVIEVDRSMDLERINLRGNAVEKVVDFDEIEIYESIALL